MSGSVWLLAVKSRPTVAMPLLRFIWRQEIMLFQSVIVYEYQTTNLGVGSSNLSGRAISRSPRLAGAMAFRLGNPAIHRRFALSAACDRRQSPLTCFSLSPDIFLSKDPRVDVPLSVPPHGAPFDRPGRRLGAGRGLWQRHDSFLPVGGVRRRGPPGQPALRGNRGVGVLSDHGRHSRRRRPGCAVRRQRAPRGGLGRGHRRRGRRCRHFRQWLPRRGQ